MSDKITINKIDELYNKEKYCTATFKTPNGDDVQVKIKKYLTIEEEQDLVERVSSAVISEDGYLPAVKEPLFFAIFLQLGTNVGVPTKKGVGGGDRIFDLNKINDWLHNIEIKDILIEFDMWNYIEKLEGYIDSAISYKKKQLLNKTPLNDFASKLSNVVDGYQQAYGDDFRGLLNLGDVNSVTSTMENDQKATILPVVDNSLSE